MQEKTKLYVDKNTPNVEKKRPNVDEKRAKKLGKTQRASPTTMKNTRKGARGATVSPPKEKRPPAGGRGRGSTGAAPPTATDKPKPTKTSSTPSTRQPIKKVICHDHSIALIRWQTLAGCC